MIPFDTAVLFMGVALALAAVPGPDNIFVLTQSALHGRLSGIIVTLGLCLGLLGHTTAAALGVAALFQTSPWAFTALKYAGAAYLVFLAYKGFTAKAAPIGEAAPRASSSSLFLRGLIMNLTNPKVTIFILAFVPQFITPENGSFIAQFFQFGGLFMLATLLVFGAVALAAGSLGTWLKSRPEAQLWMNRLSGVVFLALALKLVTASK